MNVPIGCTTQNCVAEIRMDDHGNPFGELTPFVHFFGEVPKSGTKLYYSTPMARDKPFWEMSFEADRAKDLSDDMLIKIYSEAFRTDDLLPYCSSIGGIKEAAIRAMRAIIAADRKLRGGT